MPAGKERIIHCADCGVEVVTYSNRTKFCRECAGKQQWKYEKNRQEKERLEKNTDPDPTYHACDSPEKIKKCLNCTKPVCNNCLGGINRRVSRGTGKCYAEGKEEFLACMKSGMSMLATARKVGITSETCYRWRKRLREEGLL